LPRYHHKCNKGSTYNIWLDTNGDDPLTTIFNDEGAIKLKKKIVGKISPAKQTYYFNLRFVARKLLKVVKWNTIVKLMDTAYEAVRKAMKLIS